jgi:predicted DNA-binding protein (MmcQ/YjbR family)
MCFKCVPEKFAELVKQEHIRPAPYVGRYNGVVLNRLDALRDGELQELIQPSLEMVAAKAPKNSHPIEKKATVKGKTHRKKS